ncbi:hypothetical protein AX17_000936 [Amanita inopinata Kibby_2008]|nr:hypothetical protein AX17_000936 [Amanita inopinata Kibby_2008]
MEHLHQSLVSPEKRKMLRALFSRHSPNRLLPGSIIAVTSEHAPTSFTGVLLAIRRRGLDTSFTVRNIIQRTGVEMQFFAISPHLKDIKGLSGEDEHDCWKSTMTVKALNNAYRRGKSDSSTFKLENGDSWREEDEGGWIERLFMIDSLPQQRCLPSTMPPNRPRSLRALAFGITRRNTSPGPPSPTFSDATNASAINFGPGGPEKIITRSNLKTSIQALEDLVNTCVNYRAALVTMSKVTAAFADAMERCSGLKGPSYEASTRLQAASGVHHLVGNQWHVLAETLDKKFEKPLKQHLETYRTIVMERSACYERALRERSRIIRDTETRSMNKKERNLQSFREALAVLQRQVDELDELKAAHYQEIVEHEEEAWDVVQGKVCLVVRSTMDVFDRFTAKASDPIIEPMLQSVPDPFDSYGPPQSEDQIFSILAPLSIMTNAQASLTPSPLTVTPERDAIDALPSSSSSKITSWLPITSNGASLPVESTEWSTPTTTPHSTSPPSTLTRRHSIPSSSSPRKAENKLRSILTVIDESYPHAENADLVPPTNRASLTNDITGGTEKSDRSPNQGWSFTYNSSQLEDNTHDNNATPRHPNLFVSPSPPALPPGSPPAPITDHVVSDDTVQAVHAS